MVATRTMPSIGGIEIHVNEVAPRLADAGADVTVLTTDPGRRWLRNEHIGAALLRRFPAWPEKRDFSVSPGLYRAIRTGQWDLVHCQGYQSLTAPLAMRAAAAARIPYLVTLHSGAHSSSLRNRVMRFQWSLLRPLLAGAQLLVAVSEFEAELFSRGLGLPRGRFAVIPNGSDLPPVTRPQPDAQQGPLIASVGRLERYKGHHLVLGAFPRVLGRFPNARLRIAGSGPDGDRLVRMAKQLGIADHVTVEAVPSGDRQGMAALLVRSALVVLLSSYEAQGISAHEALSLGTPVLVAYSSALKELADQSLAAAVPLEASREEIAIAMIQELEEPRIAVQAKLPTWSECASGLLAAYQGILNMPLAEGTNFAGRRSRRFAVTHLPDVRRR